MRLPFQKQKIKGKYSLINDPDISDTESEDAVIYKKSFGQVELNLLPRRSKVNVIQKRDRLKCGCLILAVILVVCSAISLAVYMGNQYYSSKQNTSLKQTGAISNSSTSQPLSDTTTTKAHVNSQTDISSTHGSSGTVNTHGSSATVNKHRQSPNWKKSYSHSAGEGGLRLFDVDGDGADDIIFSMAAVDFMTDVMDVAGSNFGELHRYCEIKNLTYPCVNSMVALRGFDGQELWRFNTRSGVFLTVCDVDLNGDGQLDCISTGRQATVVAFDPRKGEVLWTCEDGDFIASNWNIYQAMALQDWDEDGVTDVLIVNGGDPQIDPEDHNRTAARAIVLSGATGIPLGRRYLEMPDNKESYMSPALYSPPDGSTPYVLFGSGGETVPGDLLAMSLTDFCNFILEQKAKTSCPQFTGDLFWGHADKDSQGFIHIFRGKIKGVMVPPVMVDVNKDGVRDLVVSAYEGAVILFDGRSLTPTWTADFSGMESYSSPAPGYFDDDDTLDFMVHWCQGAWETYTGSNASVISGKDGHVLWTVNSATMQMSSGLSLKTHSQYRDMYLFRVQGRDSKFTWNEDRIITRQNDSLSRDKRHGKDHFQTPENSGDLDKETVFQLFKESHLTCLDDLSTFTGEVLLLERSISNNPIRVLNMPAEKFYYDLPDNHAEEQHEKIMKQLYPDRYKDLLQQNDDNMDSHEDQEFPGENGPPDQDEHNDGEGDSGRRSRQRRHLGKADDSPEENEKKRCTVASNDKRTTGAIGDVDGDGMLDYVSVLALEIPLVDDNYNYHSLDNKIVIQKINLETSIMDGALKNVPANAETSLRDTKTGLQVDQADGVFKPMSMQTWTAFMGKSGNNVY